MLELIQQVFTVNTILVGVVTCLFVYWLIQKFKYRLPPGPLALPLIGNMLQIKNDALHEQFYEWSLKYGPVISVYLGPMYNVVVNDIDTAMEVLVKKGADFASRMRTPSLDVMSDGAKDIAFGQYGPTWRLHRKISAKALRNYMSGEALEERVHDALEVCIEELDKQKEPTDPESYISFLVVNILNSLCYGEKYTYKDTEWRQILKVDDESLVLASGYGFIEDLIPGISYVWESPKMTRLKAIMKEINDTLLVKKFLEHKNSFDRDNIRDFADTLLLARQEAEEDPDETHLEKLSDAYLIQTLSDIYFAGIDTSRLTLRWAILHIVAYPDIQAKCQDEIDRVVGNKGLPKMSHRAELSYTEAVLHESMRLASVAPTGVPHMTTCDTSIAGYDIPKNTNVTINHWALHHDPKQWADVEEFKPERYLDSNGKLGPKPTSWLPFSAGRRVCLGETVAKPELHLLFATLLQQFKWSLPEGSNADLYPNLTRFALFPKEHKLIITRRKST